jgi:hypothetical protein
MASNQVLALGLSNDGASVSQIFVAPAANSKKVTAEASEILEATRDSLLQNFQRKNIDGTLGRWCCLKKPNSVYFSLSRPAYPERLAYQMLNVG